MWPRLSNPFAKATSEPIFAPVSKDNVLLITAYPKKGVVTISYNGKVKTAKFTDRTLRNMMKGIRFEDNAQNFLSCVAHLLKLLLNITDATEKDKYIYDRRRA